MDSVEINLGLACNCRCLYCPSMPEPERRFAPRDEVVAEIERAASRGIEEISFSGGEPTAFPDFESLVARCRNLGCAVGISTNGLLLEDADRLAALIDAGLTRVGISFNGSDAAMEDRIAGQAGAFGRKQAALDNLLRVQDRLPGGLKVKWVLHRKLLSGLEAAIEGMHRRGVPVQGFNLIRPVPEMGSGLAAYVPRVEELRRAIRRAAACNELEWHANFAFLDVPPCCFPWEVLADGELERRYRGHAYEREITQFYEQGPQRAPWRTERISTLKSKAAACRDCRLNGSCEGIWNGYLALFGEREFDTAPAFVEACLSGGRA
ncbi:MAG: radical SAM protein [Deltaproteobacteria bacterium]|nr:radical SAM protein [Deltaproteobacteria bacterium]